MGSQSPQYTLRKGCSRNHDIVKAGGFWLWLIAGLISVALMWVVFSKFVVPAVIESAYRGESLQFLNSMISGQSVYPVEHYLAAWEIISRRVLGMLVVVGFVPLPLLATRPQKERNIEAGVGSTVVFNPLIVNTIVALAGFALVFYLHYLQPVGYVYFVTEDSWAEYGSFVSWAMASSFLMWMIFKDRRARKPGVVLLALGAFFVAMEEISWGQRIVGFSSPTLFAEYNLQGETNLHNFAVLPRYTLLGIATLLWSVVLPILARKSGRLRGWCINFGVPMVPAYIFPLFLLASIFLILQRLPKDAELAELFLGIAIAALSLDLVLKMRQDIPSEGIAATRARAGMMVTLGMLTVLLVQLHGSPEDLKNNLNWSAMTGFPYVGMHRQSEMVFEYLNEHPQFLRPETHLRQGVLLMRRGKYTRAKEVLEQAIADQRHFQQKWPESPVPSRIAGQALALLGQQQAAQVAFLEAMKKDRALLRQATKPRGEAMVRWSLAKTLLASGDQGAAAKQMSLARALAADPKTQGAMDDWIQENLQ